MPSIELGSVLGGFFFFFPVFGWIIDLLILVLMVSNLFHSGFIFMYFAFE